jgi:hypothetical protein
MQDRHRLISDRIKKIERISNQGHDAHRRTRGQTLPVYGITAIRATVARM